MSGWMPRPVGAALRHRSRRPVQRLYGRAYETALWPFVGFLFMPLTTLAYAWAINSRRSVEGIQLVVVVIAVLIDLGLVGGSASGRSRKADKQ